jgi:hypothetical protein
MKFSVEARQGGANTTLTIVSSVVNLPTAAIAAVKGQQDLPVGGQ